jgi:AAA+ superfamily predicted ATPase
MDMKEIFKLQMVSQMGGMMRGNGAVVGGEFNLMMMVYQFFIWFVMSISDDLIKQLPKAMNEFRTNILSFFSNKVQKTLENGPIGPRPISDSAISLHTRHFLNSLEMQRIFTQESSGSGGGSSSSSSSAADQGSEESNGMVDAILAQIAKLDNVPQFTLINKGQIMVNYKEKPLQLTKDIYVKIHAINFTTAGNMQSIKLALQSNTLSGAEISTYVKNMYQNYLQEIKNSLGNNIYFFDQKSKDSNAPPPIPGASTSESIMNHKRMMIQTAAKQLSFTMTPFYSNKQFSNIYGDEIRAIEKRIRFFMNHRDWYDNKGIPYQLGLLLSGIPGAGKTSVIRAIANLTKRHIINVNFANITTATQLKNLFYSEKLQVYTDNSLSNSQSYFIPIEQRLYVLEEIDTIGDIVKQRTKEQMDHPVNPLNDELTLGEILTVLDGTMEVPGRIVIMTTNHPEVLDAALIRPGRIDVKVHFGNASRNLIAEMYEGYMDVPFPKNRIAELPDRLLSPAEVGQIIFSGHNSGRSAAHTPLQDGHNSGHNAAHTPLHTDIDQFIIDLNKACGGHNSGHNAAHTPLQGGHNSGHNSGHNAAHTPLQGGHNSGHNSGHNAAHTPLQNSVHNSGHNAALQNGAQNAEIICDKQASFGSTVSLESVVEDISFNELSVKKEMKKNLTKPNSSSIRDNNGEFKTEYVKQIQQLDNTPLFNPLSGLPIPETVHSTAHNKRPEDELQKRQDQYFLEQQQKQQPIELSAEDMKKRFDIQANEIQKKKQTLDAAIIEETNKLDESPLFKQDMICASSLYTVISQLDGGGFGASLDEVYGGSSWQLQEIAA